MHSRLSPNTRASRARPSRARLFAGTIIAGLALHPALALPPTPDAVLTNTGGAAPTFITNGSTADVTLNAARTLMQFNNGYSIQAGETVNYRFANRSDIAIIQDRGQQGGIFIGGNLNAFVGNAIGGNIWLISPGGVFFGQGASVDVGGLIASTATPTNLTAGSGGVLDLNTSRFDFGIAGYGTITIDEAARISAHGGNLAFVATRITSNPGTSITATGGGSVLYGAVDAFTIRFVRTAADDLDLIDFEMPNTGTNSSNFGAALNLAGATTAGNIYLATVSRSTVVASVINASGTLTAQSASNVNGDIVLAAGGDIIARAPVRQSDGWFRTDANLGAVNAGGSFRADVTGRLTMGGNISAGDSVLVRATSVDTLGITASNDVIITAGDADGSTAAGGSNGYGAPYRPSGGGITDYVGISAGDDIILTAAGRIGTQYLTLTGMGQDLARDPGGRDSTGDGRQLLLTTTGSGSDISIGILAPVTVTGATHSALTSSGSVTISALGTLRLDSIAATDAISISMADLQAPGDATLTGGTFTAGSFVDIEGGHVRLGSVIAGAPTGTRYDAIPGIAINTDSDIVVTTLSAPAPVGLSGGSGITIGSITASESIFLNAEGGDISLESVFTTSNAIPPQLVLSAGGNISLGLGTGRFDDIGSVQLSSPGTITVDTPYATHSANISAGGNVSVSGASVQIDSLASGGDAIITATAGDATVSGNAEVMGDLSVLAPFGHAGIDSIALGGSLLLAGDTASVNQVQGPYFSDSLPFNITIRAASGGFTITDGTLSASNDVTIDVGGDLNLIGSQNANVGTINAGRDIRLTAGGTLLFGSNALVSGGRDLWLNADIINAKALPLAALRDLHVTATTSLSFDTLTAGDDLVITAPAAAGSRLETTGFGEDNEDDGANITISGGTFAISSVVAAGNLSLTLDGALTLGDFACPDCGFNGIQAGGAVSLTAGSFVLADNPGLRFDAGGGLAITATAGSFGYANDLTPGGDLTISATGDISLGTVEVSQFADIRGSNVSINSLTVRGDFGPGSATVIATSKDPASRASISTADVLGDLTVTASAGTAALGTIMVSGTATINAGQVTLDTLTGRTGFRRSAPGGNPAYADNVIITVSDGDFTYLGDLGANIDLRIGVSGAASLGTLSAGHDLAVDAIGRTDLTSASAGHYIILTGSSLGIGSATAGLDALITANSGDIAVGGASAGQDIVLTADAGTVTAASLASSRDTVIHAASLVIANLDSARDALLTANSGAATISQARVAHDLRISALKGPASLGPATIGHDLSVTGTSVSVASVGDWSSPNQGYGGTILPVNQINLTALDGDVTATADLHAAAGISISASGAASLASLDSKAGLQITAGGMVTATSLHADRSILLSGSAISVASLTANSAGDGLATVLTAGPGGITLGGLTVSTGDAVLNSQGLVSLISAATPGGSTIITGTAVTTGSIDAATDIRITASGAADLAGQQGLFKAGRDVIVTAASLAIGSTGAARDIAITVSAGDFSGGGQFDAGRDLALSASGTLGFASLAAVRDLSLSGGSISGTGASAGRDFTASAATSLRLTSASAGDDVILSAARLILGTVSATGLGPDSEIAEPLLGSNIRITGGDLTGNSLDAARDISVAVASISGLGSLSAGRDASLAAASGGIGLGSASVRRDVTITADRGDAMLGTLAVGRDVTVRAATITALTLANYVDQGQTLITRDARITTLAGDFTFTGLVVGRDLALNIAGNINGANASAGQDFSLTASGSAVLTGDASAGRNASVAATGISVVGVTAGGDLTMTGGDVTASGALKAGDDVRVSGTNLRLAGITTTGLATDSEADGSNIVLSGAGITTNGLAAASDVRATASAALTVAGVNAGRDVSLTGLSVTSGLLVLGRTVSLNALGGDLRGDMFTAAGDLTLTASGTISLAGPLQAGGALTMTGSSVATGSISAGSDALITATAGAITLGNASIRRDLGISATGMFGLLGTLAVGRDVTIRAASIPRFALTGYTDQAQGQGQGQVLATRDASIITLAGDLTFTSLALARDLTLTIAGNVTGGGVSAGQDVNLTATGSAVLTANASAGRNVSLTANGLGLAGVTAFGDLTIAAGSGALTASGALRAGDDIRIGGLAMGLAAVTTTGLGTDNEADGSNIVLNGTAITTAAITAISDITITASAALATGTVSAGRDVRLSGLSLATGTLGVGRDLALTATGGDLTTGSLSARDLSLAASGALITGAVSASRDLVLTGARITATSASAAGDASLTATGPITVTGSISAGDDVRISGTALNLAAVTATGLGTDSEADGSNIVLAGTSITSASLSAATDIRVTASGAANLASQQGQINAGRDVAIIAASLAIGTTGAARDIAVAITAGDFSSGGQFTAGRDLGLSASGALSFGTLSAVRNLTLTGGSITGTAASAGQDLSLTATGLASLTGIASAGRNASLSAGSISLASLAAGADLTLTASTSIAATGLLRAGDDIRLSGTALSLAAVTTTGAGSDSESDGSNIMLAGTAISTGALTAAADVRATASAALTTGTISAGRDVALSGQSLALGTLGVGRDLALTAIGGDLTTGSLSARDLSLTASAALTTGAVSASRDLVLAGNSITATSAAAGGDATFTATGPITVTGAISAGDDVRISGSALTLAGVTATGLASDSEADGSNIVLTGTSITTAALTAATDVRATASAALAVGSVTAGRDVALSGLSLATGTLVQGRGLALSASGGDFSGGGFSASGDLTLNASGALALTGPVQSSAGVTLSGTSVSTAAVTAATALTITARSGSASGTSWTAGTGASITAATTLDFAAISSGTSTSLNAASIKGGSLTAGRYIGITASGGVGLATITAGNDLAITAGGALTTGAVTAGRDVRLSGQSLTTGTLSLGRDLALAATGGDLATGDLAARDLTLAASGALTTGAVSAARDLVLTGASIAAGAVTAGRDVTATASAGLGLGAITAGDDVRLRGGATSLAAITTSGSSDSEGDGANITLTATTASLGALSAPGAITIAASGATSLASASAGGTLDLSAASLGGGLILSGTDVRLAVAGALAPLGTVTARRDLSLSSGTSIAYTDLSAVRDLSLTAPVITGGRAVAGRDLTVIATTSISGSLFQAGRNLILDPAEPIVADTVIAAGDATLIGSSISIRLLQVGGRAGLSATAGGIGIDTATVTGSAILAATGRVTLGDWRSAALAIVAGDLAIGRGLTAASLRVETPGAMTLGGSGSGSGFQLSAAEIARLRIGGAAEFYAGTTGQIIIPGSQGNQAQASPGGTLTLLDFSYDPANLPVINLYAGRSYSVDVPGRVTPTLNGGTLRIGDLAADSLWRPGSITVSGGFGTAELVANCFGKVVALNSLTLLSVNDVIFGSSAFATAIRATAADAIDVAGGVPAVAGPADDRLFAVATQFRVDAGGKIVGQNTASVTGAYVGLLIGGTAANGGGTLLQISNARAVDLSGSLVLPNGELRSGPNVALISGLNGGAVNGGFRFNGCDLANATSCGGAGTTPAEVFRIEDYVVPTPALNIPVPTVTILGIDTGSGGAALQAVGSSDGTILIRRRTVP